ncbi:LacI family transcriptional regulator [Amycolatopsis antarctica]|uniref:LacI family transcriptional regulator n=1 Tax=Amycolatopsis antarctica TaxID=1854586 RepID=A0A263CYN8_9PSEU|nr:LacI family DNA-binding transcriptional regulator [Amycolatopsis antarctica]OZM70215.1 LacI family transcriptional regulator [Amycolatopsis antarctica]
MARGPRQADIARMSGVSQATVSVVLGGNRAGVRLAEDTRRRVLAAAEELGYVPDPVATRLASSRNNLLGLYTFTATFPTDVADSYYPILVGVEEEAAELGQDLILFTGSSAGTRTHDHTRIHRTRLADGCLFLGRHVPDEPIRELVASGFPVVYIGRREELGGTIPYVGADYVSASAELIGRLADAGHTTIRYLREDDDAPSSRDREQGVLAGAAAHRLDVRVDRFDGAGLPDLGRWAAEGVTAVVVEETDTGAVFHAVTGALAAAGMSAPGDLSLAVLGRPPAGVPGPVVSGFEVPRREMGRGAVRLLDALVGPDRRAAPELHRLLPCAPVAGDTIRRNQDV